MQRSPTAPSTNDTARPARPPGAPVEELLCQAYRWMVLARTLDQKVAALYRGGFIPGGAFLSRGHEALSVALALQLRPGDLYAPLIRDTAGRLAYGEPILDALRTCIGSPLGPMRARDGNVHRGRPREGYFPMISHLGAMLPVVNGALLARRMQGRTGAIGATTLGEGGTSTGAFHEALNQAAVEHLPLVVVVGDNQFAYSTPRDRQFACASLVDRAVGYGVQGHTVDGTDIHACLRVLAQACLQAREGAGPQLVVASLLRLCGHGEHDDASYIPASMKQSPLGRDCLDVAVSVLLEHGLASGAELRAWQAEADCAVDEAASVALADPAPDPHAEDWCALATVRLSAVQPTFPR